MKAKTKLTKLWSILLALVMVVGMLPTVALAAGAATADFTSGDGSAALALLNAAKTEGVADSVWDSNTNTLTLNGVDFTTTAATAVKLPDGSTIVLNGDNTIKGGNAASGACYGIFCEGNLTIQGTGTLNVTAGDAGGTDSNDRSCGIYTENALTMSSGIVKAYAGTSAKASLGIYSKGNFTISGTADVTGKGGTATGDGSFGINAEGSMIISGGKVKAIGGAGRGSDGLYSGNGQINIIGGKVEAIGGDAPNEGWSVGIFAQTSGANVTITGTADVTAIGGTAKSYYGRSYGIYGKVTLAGGTLTAATKGTTCINGTLNVTGIGFKIIHFSSNGGSGEMIAYTNADSYTLPENVFTAPTNKQFIGWSESSTGEVIDATTVNATDGKTLYAIWEMNVADFTFGDGTAALALLNEAKTDTADSEWNSVTKTLTLKGVNFETTAATAVRLPADSTIVLNGVNTIKGGNSDSDDCYGIEGLGNLTIQGTGTLNVTGGEATDYCSFGIYTSRDLIIESGTVNAIGGAAANDNNSYGIYSYYDIKISGGTVTSIGGTAEYSYGICAYDNVIIEGGIVSAKGGTATDGYSYGIRTIDLHIKISGGTVTAEGGAADYSYGTRSDDDTYISGGTITGTGGAADIKSYGIRTADYIYVSGGTATGLGGTAAEGSYGFYAYNYDVNISGGTVTAEGGAAANGSSLGIYADEDIIISDGTVIAKANTSALDYTPQALPSTYWWRTSNSGAYHKYPASAYIWDAAHTYFEIQKPGYTVTFDANGGSGEMAGADVVSGEYTLPANGFTAPEGKRFKAWSVNGTEKAVGDKITVTADTTVKAVWEAVKYTVNVTNGTASPSQAAAGATVTLTANRAPSGQVFDKWVAESGGITLADASSATTTFTMPVGDVSVKATYHTHSYGSEWETDASKHWHECSCGDKSAEAVHTAGDWIIDTPATATTAGTKHKECTDCGYVMETGTIPATGYTVSFDANGGTGTMADVTGVSGTYTLPENGFTAPEGKQFKCWSVGGTEKAVGDKITVTADTTVKAVWENIPAAPIEYEILDGANSSWTHDSDGSLSIRGNGAFSEFVGVKVDGKSVDEKYYTVKEGSTIVTLKAGYLNTLTVGSHTLEIIWTDGSASTAFTVSAQTVVESPQTGDNNSIALWIALLFVSAAGVLGTAVLGKKKQNQAE